MRPDLHLPATDILVVVPPMAHLSWPSLGVHLLQACAREEGFDVGILYVNLLLAARIGALEYANLANAPGDWLLGERLFSRAAFGRDGLAPESDFWSRVVRENADEGERADVYLDHLSDGSGLRPTSWGRHYDRGDLLRIRDEGEALVEEVAAAVARQGYRLVGATSSFDQTAASLALLGAVKRLRSETVTILGGANCEAEMAEGLHALDVGVGHIFSGESEETFLAFLRGEIADPIIYGQPCLTLDALPTPRLDDYFEQLDALLPGMRQTPVWISYETSRGCWWGQKRHCTFCGLNGEGMIFREKSPERVVEDLRDLSARHGTRHVAMTDNIMPHGYHSSLVPRLREAGLDAHIFYEQKANLSLEQVRGLVEAGVKVIQPGIEALATPLLQLMRKGVTARQNIALLRYALAAGLTVKWNLLYAFPGDDPADYESTLTLVRLLGHLSPPNALSHLSIDRFSPYFDRPDEYGLEDLRPLDAYSDVFPREADLERIAYHFKARWPSGSLENPELMSDLWRAVQSWRASWATEDTRPLLHVTRVSDDNWVLTDTRDPETPGTQFLTTAQAAAVLAGGRLGSVPTAAWAIERGYAVLQDGWCVPLATAPVAVLADIERRCAADEVAPTARILSSPPR